MSGNEILHIAVRIDGHAVDFFVHIAEPQRYQIDSGLL